MKSHKNAVQNKISNCKMEMTQFSSSFTIYNWHESQIQPLSQVTSRTLQNSPIPPLSRPLSLSSKFSLEARRLFFRICRMKDIHKISKRERVNFSHSKWNSVPLFNFLSTLNDGIRAGNIERRVRGAPRCLQVVYTKDSFDDLRIKIMKREKSWMVTIFFREFVQLPLD